MNNNPFLKSSVSNSDSNNNRFKFLDLEPDCNKKQKTSNFKSNNVNKPSESKTNSFLTDKVYTKDNNNFSRNRYPQSNSNNSKKYEKKEVVPEFNIENNLFPNLNSVYLATATATASAVTVDDLDNKDKDTQTLCFKNAIQFVKKDDIPNKNIIRPGWVELSFANRRIITNRGALTDYELKQNQQCKLENDPGYIMYNAIEKMKRNWDRNIKIYDMFAGEGAYAREFVLEPVYGPEYDSETDDDDIEYSDDNYGDL